VIMRSRAGRVRVGGRRLLIGLGLEDEGHGGEALHQRHGEARDKPRERCCEDDGAEEGHAIRRSHWEKSFDRDVAGSSHRSRAEIVAAAGGAVPPRRWLPSPQSLKR